MPKIDIENLPIEIGSGYPAPFSDLAQGRSKKRLGDALGDKGGLNQFGVNLTTIKPNAGTAQRHWHEQEDEFVFILSGEATLVEDATGEDVNGEGTSETILRAGDAAIFKAGIANGHCILNKSDKDVVLLEVGTRLPNERAHYPDIDLLAEKSETGFIFKHKDGTRY